MEVKLEKVINSIFCDKIQYEIPVYQRNYSWEEFQCKTLFDDILNASNDSKLHYIGSIILINEQKNDNIEHFSIVDGQQRITTLFLLLKALYDASKKDNDIRDEISNLLFNSSPKNFNVVNNENKIKLKPIDSDNKQLQNLFRDSDNLDINSNIYKNYENFKNYIEKAFNDGYSASKILKGINNLQVIIIYLNKEFDQPQLIFERMNTTNLELKFVDKMRNLLLMTDNNRNFNYHNHWCPVENAFETNDEFAEYVNEFVVYMLPSFNKVNRTNIYQHFKCYFDQNNQKIEDFWQKFEKFSKYYRAFINKNKEGEYSKKVKELLFAFKKLNQSTMYPFFFHIFDDFEKRIITEDELIEILKFFLNYTIRRLIVQAPTSSLRSLYRGLYAKIFDGYNDIQKLNMDYVAHIYKIMSSLESKNDIVPNDNKIDYKLNKNEYPIYKNKKLCLIILEIILNGFFKKEDTISIGNTHSIEHIFPQKDKDEKWKNYLSDKYDDALKYIHDLGNLTLTLNNSCLSNKLFREKVQILRTETKYEKLNENIIKATEWNKQQIIARTEKLTNILLDELKLPSDFNSNESNSFGDYIWYTVDDDLTTTNSLIHMLQFSDQFDGSTEKILVNKWNEALTKFCDYLYRHYPEKIKYLAQKDYCLSSQGTRILLTQEHSSIMHQPKPINKSTHIYVETHWPSQRVIEIMKNLLDRLGIPHECFNFCLFV